MKNKTRVVNVKDPNNCALCGSNATREMHPEDIENQRQAETESAENIDAFFERHTDKFKELVQTYGDGRAETKLDELRELFWASTPAGSR